ncbi:MAG: lipopolysaccharide biosynthesis protein [Salibacteraceae bacterium]
MKKYLNSQVSKNFVIYGATNALASGLPLLLLPFLTSYLEVQDMAMIAIFQLFYNFLQPFVGVNGTALTSIVFYKKSEADFKNHRSSVVWLVAISSIILLGILLLFQNVIFDYTGLSIKWVIVMLIFIGFEKFNEFLLTYWRLVNKALIFGLWRIVRVALELALSISVVVYFNTSWEGRVEGIAISGIAIGFVSLLVVLSQNNWKLPYVKTEIAEIIKFGVPFIPHVLGGVLINYADLLFIRNMLGEEATGLYSVGYQVGMIIALFQTSFNQAWVPWFYSKLNNLTDEWNTRIVKITYLYFALLLGLAFILSLVTPFLFSLFIDDRYILAQEFVIWIAFGFAINGMYKMIVNYLLFLKLSKKVGAITIFVALINLVLNYWLINENGAIGAAQSTAISFAIQFLLVWKLSATHFPMNWRLKS